MAVAGASCYAVWPHCTEAESAILSDFEGLEDALHALITFLLGLFVAEVISRWNNMYMNCQGGLTSAIDDVCILAAVCYRDDPAVSANVTRWCLASHALLFMMGQDKDPPTAIAELSSRGLLTDEEVRASR